VLQPPLVAGLALWLETGAKCAEQDVTRRLPSAVDVYPRAIALGGLSKVYGCPGLRIGWLTSHDKVALNCCALTKDYTSICSSAASEILGIMALRQGAALAEENRRIIRGNIGVADEVFGRLEGAVDWRAPAAASVAFPRCLAAAFPIQIPLCIPLCMFEADGILL
jgi:aspartate/methionine/tyrosine aminotransferase